MRIEEFSIRRYGPLPDTGRVRLAAFNLFHAGNEEGKTLTIEALARMLLGKGARSLAQIDRVEESPDGYVILEDAQGAAHKLPGDAALPQLTDTGPEHWRSIFLIRNSDLGIPQQASIYTGVTDRLTGLKTRQIEAVKDKLLEIGQVTATGRISNTQQDGKLGQRVEGALALIEDAQKLLERAIAEGLDEMECRLAELTDAIGEAEARVSALEDARKRDQWQSGSEALEKLRNAMAELDNLAAFSHQDAELWRDTEKDVKKSRARLQELEQEAANRSNKADDVEAKEHEATRQLESLQRRTGDAEQLRYSLRECEEIELKTAEMAPVAETLKWVAVGACALAVVAGLGAVLGGGIPAGAGAFLSAIVAAAASVVVASHARRRGQLRRLLTRAQQQAARAGLEGASVEELRTSLCALEEEEGRARSALHDARARRKTNADELRKLREEDMPRVREEIEEANERIDEVRGESGVQSIEEYGQRLTRKGELEQSVQQHAAVLESRFGRNGKDLRECVETWQQQLQPLKEYAGAAEGVAYSDGAIAAARQAVSDLTEERRQLGRSLQELRESLKDAERRSNEVLLLSDDRLPCDTSRDLEAVIRRLRRFVEAKERRARLAVAARRILDEINAAEQDKVAGLFGPESAVTGYFRRITDGLYETVTYEQGEGERCVRVSTASGTALEAASLSGGAYDQLYLSVRLALGEALLGGEPGFFVMDDPFVKADCERLERQLDVLRSMVLEGWQVLYFTAKDEVADALQHDIEAGAVHRIELPGMRGGVA